MGVWKAMSLLCSPDVEQGVRKHLIKTQSLREGSPFTISSPPKAPTSCQLLAFVVGLVFILLSILLFVLLLFVVEVRSGVSVLHFWFFEERISAHQADLKLLANSPASTSLVLE